MRDPSKDLRSAPKLMEGKRARKTVVYTGSTVDYSAVPSMVAPTKGGKAKRVAPDNARKGGDDESDPEDSVPIGKRRKV